VDAQLSVREWNARDELQTGIARSDAIARSLSEIIPLIEGGELHEHWRRAAAGEIQRLRDRWYPIRDGTRRCFDMTFTPLRDTRGVVMGAVMLAQDVTERAQAEAALTLERTLLREVLDSTPFAVLAFDCDGRVIEWNRAAESVFGASRADAVGRPLTDLIPESVNRERVARRIARTLAGDALVREQDRVTLASRPDIGVFETTLVPMRARDGTIVRGVALMEDITERVRAASERDRLVEILECTPDIVGTGSSEDYGVVYVN
jgi:PAS domain S-box-containing protein